MQQTLDVDLMSELQEVIAGAPISDQDKGLWLDALKNASPDIAISILSYFEEFPDKIAWATDLFKRKLSAVQSDDEDTWTKILEDEEKELAAITNE